MIKLPWNSDTKIGPTRATLEEATRLTKAGRLGEAMAVLTGRGDGPAANRRDDANGEEPIEMSAGPDGVFAERHSGDGAQEAPGGGEPGVFSRGTHHGPEGSLDYRLYRPANPASGPRPMIVMLHGCTQTPEDFARGTRMNAFAERDGFLVLYPAQSRQANPQGCWNWFDPKSQRPAGGEAGLLAGLVRAVAAREGVDTAGIFVAGLSAGGAAAAILGQTHADLFAGVGVHSGLACGAARDMAGAFAAMRGTGQRSPASPGIAQRTIVFHGRADATVASVNADRVIEQALAGRRLASESVTGAEAARPYTVRRWRGDDGTVEAEQWTLDGLGHAWSGGSPAGSYADPNGPDASAAMVSFFLG